MKKYLNLTTIAALLAALTLNTACTKEDATEDIGQPIHEPMALGVGIGGMKITRAHTDVPWAGSMIDNWLANALVTIHTTDAGAVSPSAKTYKVTNVNNTDTEPSATDTNLDGNNNDTYVTAKLVANGTGAGDTFYWGSTTENKVIRAWSYGTTDDLSSDYSSTTADACTYTLTTDQTSSSKEFLYAYKTINYTGRSETTGTPTYLVFKHQLARIDLTIKSKKQFHATNDYCTLGSTAGGATDADKIPVINKFAAPTNETSATAGEGDVTWTDFWYDHDSDGGTPKIINPGNVTLGAITPREKGEDTNTGADASTYPYLTKYSAVVLPGEYKDLKLFVINYDGAVYVYKPSLSEVLAAGNIYAYTITITDQGLNVSATIKPWSDAGGSYGGSAVLE